MAYERCGSGTQLQQDIHTRLIRVRVLLAKELRRQSRRVAVSDWVSPTRFGSLPRVSAAMPVSEQTTGPAQFCSHGLYRQIVADTPRHSRRSLWALPAAGHILGLTESHRYLLLRYNPYIHSSRSSRVNPDSAVKLPLEPCSYSTSPGSSTTPAKTSDSPM